MEKNSSNSSKPPSSDITKPQSEQRQPGKRHIGGQPKHVGKTRDLLPPEKVNEVKELKLEENNCRNCGHSFIGEEKEQKVLIQQTIELIENPIEVIEYSTTVVEGAFSVLASCNGKTWQGSGEPFATMTTANNASAASEEQSTSVRASDGFPARSRAG